MRLNFYAYLTLTLFYKKECKETCAILVPPLFLFACFAYDGHGDGPWDGNDNWMVINSLTSPAQSVILGVLNHET